MPNSTSTPLSRVLYLPHGGGPLPLLGDQRHEGLVAFLTGIGERLGEPSAILVISAHWEEARPTITGAARPALIYDYYGFPEESYSIRYAAPGQPALAKTVLELVNAAGFQGKLDERRGFDHGLFIPLKLMYPLANIPCLQLSLLRNLDPGEHIALGKSLASLREKDVLIVGSGMSFHNMKLFFSQEPVDSKPVDAFHHWLLQTCIGWEITAEEREQRLKAWDQAPAARFCHPREEHLLPLHVCFGAACTRTPVAEVVFDREVMGKRAIALLW